MKIPEHIGEAGRAWLKNVVKSYTFSKDEMTTILIAAVCLDRIADAQRDIEENGILINDRFDIKKANPACKIEQDNGILFARLCREVGLFAGDESRLPRKGGAR